VLARPDLQRPAERAAAGLIVAEVGDVDGGGGAAGAGHEHTSAGAWKVNGSGVTLTRFGAAASARPSTTAVQWRHGRRENVAALHSQRKTPRASALTR
jgi:hypothetical protein